MSDEQDISGRGPARAAPRDSLFLLSTVKSADGREIGKLRVRNLSATGLMADCEYPVAAGSIIICNLRGLGDVPGTVAWARNGRIGVAFDHGIDPQMTRKTGSGETSKVMLPDYLRSLPTGTRIR